MEYEFPEELTIEVKQEHIDGGKETFISMMRCHTCPIARAALEAVPAGEPSVGPTRLSFLDPNGTIRVQYRLPGQAADFIRNFDRRVPVEPFTFTAKRIGA